MKFFGFKNRIQLLWKITAKKKRYHAVITGDKFMGFMLRLCGYRVLPGYDEVSLEEIKRPDAL